MITQLLLSAALSPGQPPATLPTAPPPMTQPGTAAAPAPAAPPAVPPPAMYAPAAAVPCATCPPEEEKKDDGPKTLFMKAVKDTPIGDFLARNRLNVTGFADARYTGTNVDRLSNIPAGMGFSYNRDLPQFLWTTVERTVDTKSDEASWGFRLDVLGGSAYQYTLQRGLLTYQLTERDGQPNRFGFDPVQAYAEVYFPGVAKGLDVKVGRSFVRFGYESLNPTQSVLPSWSYAFTYNPYTQTGIFTETKLNDDWTMQNDFLIGNDNFFDNSNRFYYWGSLQWAPEKSKTTFKAGALLGYGRFDRSNNFNNPQLIDAVLTHKLTDDLTYALEFLYGWQHDVPGTGFAQWYHFVNYLTYKIDDKWSATGRVELFDDVDGNRTGFAGFYTSYTLGLTWKPCDAFMVRPEVRYDRCNNNTPFDGQKDLFGGMINAIFLW